MHPVFFVRPFASGLFENGPDAYGLTTLDILQTVRFSNRPYASGLSKMDRMQQNQIRIDILQNVYILFWTGCSQFFPVNRMHTV